MSSFIYLFYCAISHNSLKVSNYLFIGSYKGNFSLTSCILVLLVLSVGQRLCIDFSIPVTVNFLTTLRSHLNVICFCYIWFSLKMNVVYSYSCSFSKEKKEPQGSTIFLFLCHVTLCGHYVPERYIHKFELYTNSTY